MENKIYRTQEREQPTSIDGVGKKRTHKVNKIYLLPLIMSIIFTFGSIHIFANEYELTNTTQINGEKYNVVTDNVMTCTLANDNTPMYYITINEKNDYANGFLCITPITGSVVQLIYYVNQPYENGKVYDDGTFTALMQRASFGSKWTATDSYTTYEQVYQHYNLSLVSQKTIETPFSISQYTTKGEINEMTVIETVLAVFTAIGGWFAEIIPSMLAIFYNNETGLTVLGVLAVASLAIAVILLVLAWIVDFFKFRR